MARSASDGIHKQTAKTILFPITALVLCVLLIGASLDSIPDPPAVMQHPRPCLVSGVHQNPTMAAKVLAGLPRVLIRPTRCHGPAIDGLGVARATKSLAFLSLASDPSPPRFS